jgi:hypothetical protein
MVAKSFQWAIENWACIFVALIYDQSQARTRNAENTHARTHSNTPLNVAEPSAKYKSLPLHPLFWPLWRSRRQ